MKENLAMVVKGASYSPIDDSMDVVKRVVEACEDVNGRSIAVLDVHRLSDVADYFVIVSGRSDRHVQGITNRVVEELSELGNDPISVEGYDDAQWVLIDYGDIVVHVFYEPVREFYDIESLWIRAKKLEIAAAR